MSNQPLNPNDRIYFIITNKVKEGPFSIEDLKKIALTDDTLLWYHGLKDWKKIVDVPEVMEVLRFYVTPPQFDDFKIPESVSTEKEQSIQTDSHVDKNKQKKIIFKKSEIILFTGWIAFHGLALLLSTAQVKGFNELGRYSSSTIWPFHGQWTWCEHMGAITYFMSGSCESNGGITKFNGIFTYYDITDFLLYTGLSLLIPLFVFLNRKSD